MNRFNDLAYESFRNTITHVVISGDTLYKLANKYQTTVAEIMQLNKLASTMIFPNQVLFIPTTNHSDCSGSYKYITKEGDTINKINENYELKNMDELHELKLCPGQIINLAANHTRSYSIKQNDTLANILHDHNLTLDELFAINKDNWLRPNNKINV